MKLQIRQDDEAAFKGARDWLLDELGRFLREDRKLDDGLASLAADGAAIALDWKFGYGDGHLGRWTTGDVSEFLLDWCPRKLSVSQHDSVTIPGGVAALIECLAEKRLLAKGSSPVEALLSAITNATAEFVAEMGNPANFGLAKSLFTEAAARGYDLADEESVAAWMDEYNALDDDEREAILPDRLFGSSAEDGIIPFLPPVVLPPPEAIAESRADAPILAVFAKLAEFVAAGRRLTQNGNLSLADARELVPLLGTGDVLDQRIGDEVWATRSSADLPGLRLIFAWAKKAGVLRVQHGRVLATKRGLALAANPAAMFDNALDALLDLGPMTAQRHPTRAWPDWPEVDNAIDGMTIMLLISPYVQRRPVPLSELARIAAQTLLKRYVFSQWSDDEVQRHIDLSIVAVMDALELAGIVRRPNVVVGDDLALRRRGGDIEITPAGAAAVQRLLSDFGFDIPVAGRWADASAQELLTGADRDDWMALAAELEAWRQRRAPEQAVAELAAAVRELDDPGLQNIALNMMSDIGPELAEPHGVAGRRCARHDRAESPGEAGR